MSQTTPKSNSSSRAHGLDTLRSAAILSVIVFHIYGFHGMGPMPENLKFAIRQGWMGVDLFFVLSGYLIASQYFKPYVAGEYPNLWGFYRNRLFRVLPAYGAVLALYYLLPLWREDTSLPPAWEMISFTQNLFVDYENQGAFSHVWSLCVEEHFYLLLPLIVMAMMRRPAFSRAVTAIAGLVLFGVCVRGYVLVHCLRPMEAAGQSFGLVYLERIYYPTYSRLDGLLTGVTLALLKTFRPAWWSRLEKRGHLLFFLGTILVGVAVYLCKDRWVSAYGFAAWGVVIGFPVLSLGLGCLVASALSSNGWLRLKIPGAQLIATLAYSLYLTSKELIHLVDRAFPSIAEGAIFRWLVVYAVFCFVVASLLYVCVERPFLRLRDRRSPSS